ncbi:hypothetical protein [Streptomyces hydrogenans]|uniref:hypothetical protein n=1 Tax=Streptomyces hydrogenans TaxID=1873719 RepID=UPI00345DE4F9
MDTLDSLVHLCPPPATNHARPGIPSGAGAGGAQMTVPPLHARLLEVYGPGSFNDFLWIFEQGCSNPWLDIDTLSRRAADILSKKKIPEIRSIVADFKSDLSHLIQWGATDNADEIFWIPTGHPEDWPTLIVQAGQLEFQLIRRSSLEVLHGLIGGELRCPFFPEDFLRHRPTFERWTGDRREDD